MKIKLNNVRLSFPALFKAEAFKPGDDPRFKATFLIPEGSAQAKEVEKAAIAALEEKFPKKGVTIYKQIFGNNNKCNINHHIRFPPTSRRVRKISNFISIPFCISIFNFST